MAVASRGAALSAFRELINGDPVEARTILRRPYLPNGLEPSGDPVRMGPSTLIGGYGNEARYTLGAGDPETTRAIADRPSEVLSRRPSITSDTVAAYAKASLDLTMEVVPHQAWSTHSPCVIWPLTSSSATSVARRPARLLRRSRRRLSLVAAARYWPLGSGQEGTEQEGPRPLRAATTYAAASPA